MKVIVGCRTWALRVGWICDSKTGGGRIGMVVAVRRCLDAISLLKCWYAVFYVFLLFREASPRGRKCAQIQPKCFKRMRRMGRPAGAMNRPGAVIDRRGLLG